MLQSLFLVIVIKVSLNCNVSTGDLIALLSVIVAVFVFLQQMRQNRKTRREEMIETWYMNVVVLPHVNVITELYEKTLSNTISALDTIKIKSNGKIELIAKMKKIIFAEIDQKMDQIVSHIRSFNYKQGAVFINKTNELEDIISRLFDDSDVVDESQCRTAIMENKTELLGLLRGVYLQQQKK